MEKEFRVFNKISQEYGERCDLDENRIDFGFSEGITNLEFALRRPEEYAVEMWTGCYDKNGKKLFEGDRVNIIDWHKSSPIPRIGTIYFYSGQFSVAGKDEYCWSIPIGEIEDEDIELNV